MCARGYVFSDNFIPKKCNNGQFTPSESEKYEELITFFKPFLMDEAKPPTAQADTSFCGKFSKKVGQFIRI